MCLATKIKERNSSFSIEHINRLNDVIKLNTIRKWTSNNRKEFSVCRNVALLLIFAIDFVVVVCVLKQENDVHKTVEKTHDREKKNVVENVCFKSIAVTIT